MIPLSLKRPLTTITSTTTQNSNASKRSIEIKLEYLWNKGSFQNVQTILEVLIWTDIL